jgi:hypothetical protein
VFLVYPSTAGATKTDEFVVEDIDDGGVSDDSSDEYTARIGVHGAPVSPSGKVARERFK